MCVICEYDALPEDRSCLWTQSDSRGWYCCWTGFEGSSGVSNAPKGMVTVMGNLLKKEVEERLS